VVPVDGIRHHSIPKRGVSVPIARDVARSWVESSGLMSWRLRECHFSYIEDAALRSGPCYHVEALLMCVVNPMLNPMHRLTRNLYMMCLGCCSGSGISDDVRGMSHIGVRMVHAVEMVVLELTTPTRNCTTLSSVSPDRIYEVEHAAGAVHAFMRGHAKRIRAQLRADPEHRGCVMDTLQKARARGDIPVDMLRLLERLEDGIMA
jgi:hypothetical protein